MRAVTSLPHALLHPNTAQSKQKGSKYQKWGPTPPRSLPGLRRDWGQRLKQKADGAQTDDSPDECPPGTRIDAEHYLEAADALERLLSKPWMQHGWAALEKHAANNSKEK